MNRITRFAKRKSNASSSQPPAALGVAEEEKSVEQLSIAPNGDASAEQNEISETDNSTPESLTATNKNEKQRMKRKTNKQTNIDPAEGSVKDKEKRKKNRPSIPTTSIPTDSRETGKEVSESVDNEGAISAQDGGSLGAGRDIATLGSEEDTSNKGGVAVPSSTEDVLEPTASSDNLIVVGDIVNDGEDGNSDDVDTGEGWDNGQPGAEWVDGGLPHRNVDIMSSQDHDDSIVQSEYQQQLEEVAPSGETRLLSSMAVQPPEAMSVYGVDEIESLKMKLDTFHHEFQHKLYNIYQKTNILQHQHDTAAQAEVKVISTSTTAKWWKPLAVISLLLAVIGTAVIATILLLLATTSFSMEVPGESPVTPNSNEFFAKLNSSNCVLDDDYWDGYNIENLAKACELHFGSNTSVSDDDFWLSVLDYDDEIWAETTFDDDLWEHHLPSSSASANAWEDNSYVEDFSRNVTDEMYVSDDLYSKLWNSGCEGWGNVTFDDEYWATLWCNDMQRLIGHCDWISNTMTNLTIAMQNCLHDPYTKYRDFMESDCAGWENVTFDDDFWESLYCDDITYLIVHCDWISNSRTNITDVMPNCMTYDDDGLSDDPYMMDDALVMDDAFMMDDAFVMDDAFMIDDYSVGGPPTTNNNTSSTTIVRDGISSIVIGGIIGTTILFWLFSIISIYFWKQQVHLKKQQQQQQQRQQQLREEETWLKNHHAALSRLTRQQQQQRQHHQQPGEGQQHQQPGEGQDGLEVIV